MNSSKATGTTTTSTTTTTMTMTTRASKTRSQPALGERATPARWPCASRAPPLPDGRPPQGLHATVIPDKQAPANNEEHRRASATIPSSPRREDSPPPPRRTCPGSAVENGMGRARRRQSLSPPSNVTCRRVRAGRQAGRFDKRTAWTPAAPRRGTGGSCAARVISRSSSVVGVGGVWAWLLTAGGAVRCWGREAGGGGFVVLKGLIIPR
ncbi:hypothetical protein F4780DRAFT_753011 [Xylariomycetidae sp. FL0641]|nr:hypothetical protein F4780DRAFT_753011 [Xylariomycetidae sp. FL0641]